MKKIIFLLLCLTSYCFAEDNHIKINVLKIYGGDTIQASIEKEKFSIRLTGIDCYETSSITRAYKQAYENNLKIDEIILKGQKSKEYLEKLYNQNKNKQAYLDFKGIDKYNRALGIVYFDKININQEMLNNGGCTIYKYTYPL